MASPSTAAVLAVLVVVLLGMGCPAGATIACSDCASQCSLSCSAGNFPCSSDCSPIPACVEKCKATEVPKCVDGCSRSCNRSCPSGGCNCATACDGCHSGVEIQCKRYCTNSKSCNACCTSYCNKTCA